MPDLAVRLGIILALGALTWLLVVVSRGVINRRKRRALAAAPLTDSAALGTVRILAFSTPDCRQCHTHQWPAIQRVLAARPGQVVGEEIDAILRSDLATRYRILTVPSTVVLDAAGRARAVNYGLTSAPELLAQIDALG